MEKKYDVYAIGNALVDTEIEVGDDFLARMGLDKGLMTLVDETRQDLLLKGLAKESRARKRACGGSACNTVVATRHLGGTSYYACKVANDETGDFFVRDLLAAGVDTNMGGPREDGVSGKCLVMVTPDAERTMNTFLGISQSVSDSALDEQAIAASRYVYLEGYLASADNARAAAVRLRQLAKKHGVRTSLTFSDPAMVQFCRDGLAEMLGDGVDLLFCNQDEAQGYTDTDNPEAALQALKSVCGSLVITLGAKGALLWDGTESHYIDPLPAKAVDTNGAGDLFAGAFLYAITHGYDFPTAGHLAAAASSRLIARFGPRLPADDLLAVRRQVLGE